MNFFVYILTNKNNSVFYIGITRNLIKRIYEHKNNLIPGFTSRYQLSKVVYFEEYPSAIEAIRREKQLKNWHRQWKINLIKKSNFNFDDLSQTWGC